MTCPAPLVLSLHADRALPEAEAAAVDRHLHDCARCSASAAALDAESAALRRVLQQEDAAIPIPRLERPLGLPAILGVAAAAAAAAALAGSAWDAVAAAMPAGLRWLNPLEPAMLLELLSGLVVYFTREGQAMIVSMSDFAAGAVIVGLLGWGAFALARRKGGAAALLSLLVLAAVLPRPSEAVEIRRGEGLMTVPAGETIDDTLMIFGESVSIDGNVTGDVVAFARRVTVRGDVGGDLITGAETVNVEGAVGGNLIGFGRDVTLTGARVAHNLYGFGSGVSIRSGADVGGNAITFGSTVQMHGRVGVDLLSFARELEVRGEVVRNVESFGENVTVLPQARIGGNLTTRLPERDNLRTAGGATIGGAVDTQVDEGPDENRYLTASFYLRQALRLGAAFLTGLLLLWLMPSLRTLPISSGGQVLRAAGLGLVAVVVLPVLSIVLLVTIIGIPLGLAGLVVWLLALYFAKIVVAQQIGRKLFEAPHGVPHYAATLIAGLVVVLIAVNVPFLGGIANVVLTLVGLGLIAGRALGQVRPAAG